MLVHTVSENVVIYDDVPCSLRRRLPPWGVLPFRVSPELGATGGETLQVDRRVQVAVDHEAARLALELSLVQSEVGLDRPAPGAHLGGHVRARCQGAPGSTSRTDTGTVALIPKSCAVAGRNADSHPPLSHWSRACASR